MTHSFLRKQKIRQRDKSIVVRSVYTDTYKSVSGERISYSYVRDRGYRVPVVITFDDPDADFYVQKG